MAMVDDSLVATDPGLTAEAELGPRRGKKDPEVLDELAQETKRTTLLDRVEHQLKGQLHVSRALVVLEINEEKKTPATIEQEFKSWKGKQEKQGEDLSGVLVFVTGAAIHLLEGPTELIFKALEFMHTLCGSKDGDDPLVSGPLVTNLRILHFTELRGVRASKSWCSVLNSSKPQGGSSVPMDEENCPEFVYATYNKLVTVCLKIQKENPGASKEQDLKNAYKKVPELMPGVDEVFAYLAKGIFENFFTYPEFHKVFVAPFNLVLHSELLWPMPPSLSY